MIIVQAVLPLGLVEREQILVVVNPACLPSALCVYVWLADWVAALSPKRRATSHLWQRQATRASQR